MREVVSTDMAQRYGAPAPRWVVLAVAAVIATVGLGWLVWVMLVHARPLAQSDTVSFRVLGEHRAEATFVVVRRSREVEASCLLRAQAPDHTIVGERTLVVGASRPATSTLTRSLRTERRATSVSVVGCTAEGQPQLR